jgi:creatinine amidohydrolase
MLLALAQADDVSADAVGLHAGEGETSEMLYLHPELVRMACAVPGYTGSMTDLMPRLREVGLLPLSPNGVLGDPTRADAARGQRYLSHQVTQWQCWLTEP